MTRTASCSFLSLILIATVAACETAHWARARRADSRDALLDFLSKYPQSSHRSEARAALCSLEWADAQAANTIETFEHFLAECPNEPHSQRAKESIANLRYERTQTVKSKEALWEFLHFHSSDARADACRLQLRAIFFNETKQAGNVSAYQDFLRQYSEGPDADEITQLLRIAKRDLLRRQDEAFRSLQTVQLTLSFKGDGPFATQFGTDPYETATRRAIEGISEIGRILGWRVIQGTCTELCDVTITFDGTAFLGAESYVRVRGGPFDDCYEPSSGYGSYSGSGEPGFWKFPSLRRLESGFVLRFKDLGAYTRHDGGRWQGRYVGLCFDIENTSGDAYQKELRSQITTSAGDLVERAISNVIFAIDEFGGASALAKLSAGRDSIVAEEAKRIALHGVPTSALPAYLSDAHLLGRRVDQSGQVLVE